MQPRAPCVIVDYCLQFVVGEVNGKTVGGSLVAVTNLLTDVVVVVMSGRPHLTAAQVTGFTDKELFKLALCKRKAAEIFVHFQRNPF